MKLKEMHFAARLLLSLCLCFVAQLVYAAPAVLSISADHTPVAAGQTFALTVTYDTAMDTSINPVFSFPTSGEDPTSFLTATTAGWTNATTFVQNYQAQPVSLTVSTVDVAVDGAKDTLGAAQTAGFQADVFDVVFFIPAVNVFEIDGIVVQGSLFVTGAGGHVITAADVGKTVEFLFLYDIPSDDDGCGNTLNAFMCPTLTFPNAGGTLASLTNVTSQWQTRTRYKVSWTIADGDEQFDNININVGGGVGRRDDVNNKNADRLFTSQFSIDTSHPTVSSVTSSTTSITNGTPANGLVTLTAAYSKPMDTSTTPTFSFPNQSLATVLTATTGSWTDTTHYAQTFKVSGAGISFASVDVKVSGAFNPHGNLQRENTIASVFSINLAAPPTATPFTFASLVPLVLNIPGVTSFPGAFDTSCCGDLLARVLSQALNQNLSYIGQSATGAVILGGFHGARLTFLVTTVTAGDVRAEGVYAVGDGRYQVVSGGIAATIVPTLMHLDQLVSLLPTGSTVQMAANGVLTATIDGVTYVVQPGVDLQTVTNTSGRPLIATVADGSLHFTDASGNDQILYPAFLEPQTLLADLRTIDGAALSAIQLDGTARTAVFGQTYIVVPDLTLSAPTTTRPSQGWTQSGARYFLYLDPQRGNTVQGLSVKTN